MKKFHFHIPLMIGLATMLSFSSCKKDDYILGGTISNPKVNQSAYDFLNGNAWQLFDTVLMIIDKAGLKEEINKPGITFFVPTDYAVFNYLNNRTIELQKKYPLAKYTLDSLLTNDLQRVKDSLKMYIIKEALTFDKLTNNGKIYQTALAGDSVVVSFEYTKSTSLGYNEAVSSVPQVTYFTQLWKALEPPFVAGDIPDDIGIHTLVQTSGVQTNAGSILNVLTNGHTLFFYGTKK